MRARAAHRSWPDVGSPVSRPRSFCTCTGSSTTPGRSDLAMMRPKRVAVRARNSVGTRGLAFAAQWLAYALPYRRFVGILTDANARLGADVDRYSFIVVDLHHLLLAGLPAHFESYYMPSQC